MKTELLDYIKTNDPEIYNLVYPKAYQYVPSGYTSPKLFANNLLSYICDLTTSEHPMNQDSMLAMKEFLIRARPFKLPTFFIDNDFYKSMLHTDVKEGIDFNNFSLPFPCQLLYLPMNVEEEFRLYEPDTTSQISILGIGTYRTKTGKQQYIYFQVSEIHLRFIAKSGSDIGEYIKIHKGYQGFNLAINILLARQARPSLYSQGTTVRTRGKKVFRELWTPNFIGKGYKVKEDKESKGTHSSPRIHWRRGHFRNQHFGTKNAEQKIIWIEPTLVGVEE